jgi:hypothetical protein
MYTKKNSIILFFLLFLVTGIGLALEYMGRQKLETLRHQNNALTDKLNGSMEIVKTWHELKDGYEKLHSSWDNADKKILAADEPALTISYIHWLTSENNFGMEFDFALRSVEPRDDISSFSFSLSGEGEYRAIYDFVRFLTDHPILYKIEKIDLNVLEENPNLIKFNVDIRGYFLTQKWELHEEFNFAEIPLKFDKAGYYDIFTALVNVPKKPSPVNAAAAITAASPLEKIQEDSELLGFKLLAITNNSVYLLSHKKQLVKMEMGQSAHGGKLIQIDKQKSIAVFNVIQDNRPKQIILGLD